MVVAVTPVRAKVINCPPVTETPVAVVTQEPVRPVPVVQVRAVAVVAASPPVCSVSFIPVVFDVAVEK